MSFDNNVIWHRIANTFRIFIWLISFVCEWFKVVWLFFIFFFSFSVIFYSIFRWTEQINKHSVWFLLCYWTMEPLAPLEIEAIQYVQRLNLSPETWHENATKQIQFWQIKSDWSKVNIPIQHFSWKVELTHDFASLCWLLCVRQSFYMCVLEFQKICER